MPIYEYLCSKGHSYDRAEGFDAPSVQKCPTCGARARRQISMPSVIFKGSGFYSTDNRKGSSFAGNGGSKSTDTKSADTGSSDSKAEAATAD